MPHGKPAGVRCVHLTADQRCALFGRRERPLVCQRLQPCAEMCGHSRRDTLRYLTRLERTTAPPQSSLAQTSIRPDGRAETAAL
jgi:hypothetical protein